jgi:hypothetical protein
MKFVVFEKNYLLILSQGPLLKHCIAEYFAHLALHNTQSLNHSLTHSFNFLLRWHLSQNIFITNTNFIIFCLTRPVLDPTIFHTQGEQTNHYMMDVVQHVYVYCINLISINFFLSWSSIKMVLWFMVENRLCIPLPLSMSRII